MMAIILHILLINGKTNGGYMIGDIYTPTTMMATALQDYMNYGVTKNGKKLILVFLLKIQMVIIMVLILVTK